MGRLSIRFLTLFLLLTSSTLVARQSERAGRTPVAPILVQFVNRPSMIPEKSRLEVFFRIPYRFFIFVRNTDPHSPDPFIAEGDLLLELQDSLNGMIVHDAQSLHLASPESSIEFTDARSVQGVFAFDLRPGNYSARLELDDKESDRKYVRPRERVLLKDFSHSPLQLSSAMFIEPVESVAVDIPVRTFNHGGNIPFGKLFSAAFDLYTYVPLRSIKVVYSIVHRQMIEDAEMPVLDIRDTVKSSPFPLTLVPELDSGRIQYHWSDAAAAHSATVIVPINSDTLQQGHYSLEVTAIAGDTVISVAQDFDIFWFDMPASLHSLPFAIDALQFITDENQFHQMRDANEKYQRILFDQFWHVRDPSPGTAFNERMAEYYRRVDHAFTAFSTVRQINGVHTDRGKAYILYGPPSKIERSLAPDSFPTETWFYPSLHQKLVFTDERRIGDYQLKANIALP